MPSVRISSSRTYQVHFAIDQNSRPQITNYDTKLTKESP